MLTAAFFAVCFLGDVNPPPGFTALFNGVDLSWLAS